MSLCLSSVCHAVIFDHLSGKISYDRRSMLIILFNIVSVGTMSILSVFADRVNDKHTGIRLSVFLTLLGYFLPTDFGIDMKVVLLGLGSAVFYSFASSSLLSRSNGKSRDIGLLLGGSGIGIACSSFAGFAGHFFAPLLMILAIPSDKYQREPENEEKALQKVQKTAENEQKNVQNAPFSPLPLVFLTLSYLLLSYEFSSLNFSWNVWFKTQFELLLVIGLGRAVGGFVSDIFGRMTTIIATSCGGTLLIYFCADNKRLSLLGLFLLSMSLSPIVTSLTRMIPKKPAFSFAIMSGAAYLGQTLSLFIGFQSTSMLFICAALVVVAIASETPFSPRSNGTPGPKNKAVKAILPLVLIFALVSPAYAMHLPENRIIDTELTVEEDENIVDNSINGVGQTRPLKTFIMSRPVYQKRVLLPFLLLFSLGPLYLLAEYEFKKHKDKSPSK